MVLASQMKNLLWAVICAALAIITPYMLWSEFQKVSVIYDGGQEGALEIERQTGTRTSRKGSKTFYYSAYLERKPVSLSTSKALSTGVPFRVIYLPEKLDSYTSAGGASFYDYVLGNKEESKWDLFVRKVRFDVLMIAIGAEVLWLAGLVLFFRSFLKRES
jgi:hypothetical protein